jgi:23S rRNA pseudouridine1911/1915/1917 synthase
MRRPPDRLKLVADRDEQLLQFVVRRGGVSPELALAAIERGGAFLRGRRERASTAVVHSGDRVEVTLRAPQAAALERERILHLDRLVLAVDKPAGVAAQEDLAGGPALPQLCSALLAELGEEQTQALLVHRLDRGTTGVTVLARTHRAQSALLEQFRLHQPRKEYRALVAGAPAGESGEVATPLEGRPARTGWQVLERFAGAALVAALPLTGRTHQVRLHLRELGCPLLGDKAHGGPPFLTRASGARLDLARPMLHARSLALRHPAGGDLRLLAPTPGDFEAALVFLRG